MTSTDAIECVLRDRGNGLPAVGEHVVDLAGGVYEVTERGRAHAAESPGMGDWASGRVRRVDWLEVTDEPTATCEIEERRPVGP